jgi:pantoate kinase
MAARKNFKVANHARVTTAMDEKVRSVIFERAHYLEWPSGCGSTPSGACAVNTCPHAPQRNRSSE